MTEKRRKNIYGQRLRQARESSGLSQKSLGVAAGLDEAGAGTTISRYENGIHQAKVGLQERLAQALQLPLAYFYVDNDEVAEAILSSAHKDGQERKATGPKA